MTDSIDPYLPILQDIEKGLVDFYNQAPDLTDAGVVFALDVGKIATKQRYGFAKSQNGTAGPEHQAIVLHIVAVGIKHIDENLTLDAYVKCIDQVRRSVERHRSYGVRGYYDYVRSFF